MKTSVKLFLLGALALTALSCTHINLEYRHGSPSFTGGVAETTKAEGNLWYGDKVGIMTIDATRSQMVSDYANVGYQTDASGVTTAIFTVINPDDDIIFENSEETVTFVAYAPYYESAITELPGQNKDGVITGNTETQTTYDSQVALDNLYAGAKTGSESVPEVHFNFYHKMTQLIVKFTAGDGLDASDIQAGTYTLGGIIQDGEFNLDQTSSAVGTCYTTGTTPLDDWDLQSKWYVTKDGDDYDICFTSIIYPQTPTTLPLYAHVDQADYTGTDLYEYLDDGEFKEGCSYTYNITVNEHDLTVTGSTITDWNYYNYDVILGGGTDDQSTDDGGTLAYGTDDGVEVDTDYTTIVTWASGTKAYDYTATVNGSSESYEILKLGSSSDDGSDTCTIPAGSTSFGYYVVAWNGKSDVPYQITIGDTVYTDVCQGNSGFSGSGSSYSLVDVSASDYRLVTFASALTEETTVTVETTATSPDPRAGFFAVKYFPNDSVDDNSGNGSDEETLVYGNDFDKASASSSPKLSSAADYYQNETGSGISTVTYAYSTNMSVRTSSGSADAYEGASGTNNIFFGTDSPDYFTIQNITLPDGETNYSLTFGAYESGSAFNTDEFKVYLSAAGETWVRITYSFEEGTPASGKWGLASSSFTVPSGTTTLYIYFEADATSVYRLDDVALNYTETAGTSIDFSTGVSVPEEGDDSGNSDDVETTGDGSATNPYTIADCFAILTAGTESTSEVYLTGTVSEVGSLNSSYGELTYYLSDDGTTTSDNLEIYEGYGLNGEKITSTDYLSVGDVIVLSGVIKNYNGTFETNYGSKIYSINGDTGSTGEQDEKFVANVTWSGDSSTHCEPSDVANIDGVSYYNVLKIGTASAVGSGTCTLPAGTTSFSFYCLGWSSTPCKVTIGENSYDYTADGSPSVSGSSPYTISSSELDENDYCQITFDALTEDTTLTFETTGSGYRVVVFGAKYAPEN